LLRFLSALPLLVAVVLLAVPALHAQVGSGTLTGTVQDPSGAVIPGATIALKDMTNGSTRTQTSNGSGFFSFVNLPSSTYQATVTATGFNTLSRKNIVLHIGDQVNLNALSLGISANGASVTVTADQEIAPTTSGEQSYTLTSEQIQKLNIQGRSAIELLGLVPGAANAGNFNSSSYQSQTEGFTQNTSAFSVNGNRFDQVQIISDGAPVTDVQTAGASAVTPNVDMIQESKIQTAAYASDSPNGPIVVQTETKSGGKNFHGEAYFTARNNALNDTDWRVKHLGLNKPNDSFYYPGGNIGGPVIIPGTGFNRNRDKLFFFFGFEKAIQNVQDPILDVREAIVPTADERKGIFTDTAYLAQLGVLDYYQGFQPCSAQASSNNYDTANYCTSPTSGTIAPGAIDPAGQKLINLFPRANANPATTGGYNYISSYLLSQPRNQETLRIDYNLNAKNHISARYNHEGEFVPYPYGLYNTFSLSPYPASEATTNHSNSITGRVSTTLTSSLTNEATLTLTRLVLGEQINNESAVSRSALNYPYPNLYNTNTDIVPNVSFSQSPHAANLYIRGGDYPAYATNEQTLVAGDQVSKVLHNHLIKAGVYYERDSFNKRTTGQDNGSVTTSYYNTGNAIYPTYVPSTGNPFADLLVGAINSYGQSSSNFMAQMLLHRFDFFAEDIWQARPRLTLNYGVRVDHIGRWYDQNGRNVVFVPSLAQPTPAGSGGNTTGLVSHATNPSLVTLSGTPALGFRAAASGGFAYDFFGNGKTILRGGAGTNYYTDPGQNAFSAVQAPPNENFTTIYAATSLSQVSTLSTTSLYPTVYGIASQHDTKLPVTVSYNLAVSQIMPARIKAEFAYTGNFSRNLVGYTSQNVVPEGCELPGGTGQAVGYSPGTYNDQLCRPYSNLQALSTEVHNLNSYFNSAQVSVTRQVGFINLWATYTYGKTLAYNCEDPFNERRCYNPTPFDQSHNFSISYLIKLPSVSQKHLGNHKVVNGVLDGWEVSGIEQVASGSPISVSANPQGNEYDGFHNRTINFYGSSLYIPATGAYYSSPNLDPRVVVGTPDEAAAPRLVCDPRVGLKAHQYFNPNCFQEPVPGTSPTSPNIGTYRLPYIHGPHFQNDELGLFKTFNLKKEERLEIRAQAFNWFNHPVDSFIQYDSALYLVYTDPNYSRLPINAAGSPEQKLGARTVQFASKFYF
jgi:hypothetical protein